MGYLFALGGGGVVAIHNIYNPAVHENYTTIPKVILKHVENLIVCFYIIGCTMYTYPISVSVS